MSGLLSGLPLEHKRTALQRRRTGHTAPAEPAPLPDSFLDALVESVTARVLAQVMPVVERELSRTRVALADAVLQGSRRKVHRG